jgi:uncharacterized membrane protein YdjX (TVP38/TMEM64 family)
MLAGFGALCAALVFSVIGTADLADSATSMLAWLRALGWAGSLVFVAIEAAAAMVGLVPASLFGLAAGVIYGVGFGFGLAAIGLMLGAVVPFALARSAFRPAILRLLDGRAILGRFDAAMARDGWRLVMLVRVSPVMPFSITSYALALSSIGFRDYLIGTLASLPALLVYVVLGSLGASSIAAVEHGDSGVRLALLGVGVAATLLLTLRIGRLVRMAVRAGSSAI